MNSVTLYRSSTLFFESCDAAGGADVDRDRIELNNGLLDTTDAPAGNQVRISIDA
jgi:hypothetical protein